MTVLLLGIFFFFFFTVRLVGAMAVRAGAQKAHRVRFQYTRFFCLVSARSNVSLLPVSNFCGILSEQGKVWMTTKQWRGMTFGRQGALPIQDGTCSQEVCICTNFGWALLLAHLLCLRSACGWLGSFCERARIQLFHLQRERAKMMMTVLATVTMTVGPTQ